MSRYRNSRSPRGVIGRIPFLLLAFLIGATGLLLHTPVSRADASGLRLIGNLPQPPEARKLLSFSTTKVALINPATRRLYYAYGDENLTTFIREYDLDKEIPQPIRTGRLATSQEYNPANPISPNTVVLDQKRNRLLILTNGGEVAGCKGEPFCGTSLPGLVKIFVFDLTTFKRISVVNVQLTVPFMLPSGLTYSPEDDRIYLAGEIQPGGYVPAYLAGADGILAPRRPPAAVAAIDAGTYKMAWVRVLPECENPIASLEQGLLIARAHDQAALYFACARVSIWPGTSALVRIWIDPKGTIQQASSFPVEIFPIAGAYTNGEGTIRAGAFFDYISDRFFIQSLSPRTPGAWVFDGRLSAWVGFITSHDESDVFGGVQPQSGRYYIGGEAGYGHGDRGYIIASDARQTPVPQGTIFVLPGILKSPIYVDPPTRRIFVWIDPPSNGLDYEWKIYHDEIPPTDPETPLDYDVLTNDVAETAQTFSTFAGDVNGFGARVSLVGGWQGLISMCGGQGYENPCDPTDPAFVLRQDTINTPAPPSAATREVFFGRVSSVDVRNVGAGAVAQSLAPDPITDGEYRERVQNATADAIGKRTSEDTGNQVRDGLDWPHPVVTCLDSGGTTHDESSPQAYGGKSVVHCDLGAAIATASSTFSTLDLSSEDTGEIKVASGSFSATVTRDPKVGALTDSIAVARGIQISIPGTGSVVIGRVVTTARTAAHGRTGSTAVAWHRSIEDVIVKNSAGDVVYSCTDADSCDPRAALSAINGVLQTRVKVRLPVPELIKSPGGAFSAVQESDADYFIGLVTNEDNLRAVPGLEIVFYNDTLEKSRVVVQLAAIQSSSIYGISTLPSETPLGGLPIPIPSIGPIGPPIDLGGPLPGPNILPPPHVAGTKLIRSAWLLIRSPKDALLFGLTGLLFAGAIAAAWRRRVLVGEVGAGSD
jgi:hypothetical protein